MRYFTTTILFACMVCVCLSCGQKEATATNAQDNKEMKADKKANKAKQKKMNKAKTKMQGQTNYWEKLGTELNIEQSKLKSIMNLNAENNKAIDALRKTEPANLITQIKDIRIAEKKEIEKILGAALFQEKLDFDKKWNMMRSNSGQDKRKMKDMMKK